MNEEFWKKLFLERKKAEELVGKVDCTGRQYGADEREDIIRFVLLGAEFQLSKAEPLIRKDERERMGQAFIDYLENEIKTVDKRTAGLPSFKAIECMVLQTVINALKEWQAPKATEGKEG